MTIKERRSRLRRQADYPLGFGDPSVIVYCSDYSYRAWIRFHELNTILSSVMLLDYRLLTWVTSNDKDDGHIKQYGHPVPQHLRPHAPRREDAKT